MVFGIGIDSIEVSRIKKQVDGEPGLKEKLFTAREIEYCETKRYYAQNYAARFAAKEAFLKALGTGWRDGLAFGEIEIVNDTLGRPRIVLTGRAKEISDKVGITNIQVSMSHIRDYAAAIVTLEK